MKILLNGLSDRVLSLRYYVCLQRKDADCEKFCMLASAFDEEDFYKIYVKIIYFCLHKCSARAHIVWETMVLRRPERSVECRDSEKKISACADQNHAPSLTCVRLEFTDEGLEKLCF